MPPDTRSIDDIDRRLLAILQADGRISVNELAVKANVSRATAYSRFNRLRDTGVITGFRAEVDRSALGYTTTALVLVNIEQGEWPRIVPELSRLPGVEYVALTSGGFDLAMLVRVPDVAALRDVLLVRMQGMPQVRSTQTIFVLDEAGSPLGPWAFEAPAG